ncbi:MAG: hypothetical protein DRQ56_08715 [Gammaproteobacteria bacterium]|nr:MAG: hypothetical protein DRQ56_08715 [Gammaproteobacteria bacterium]
MKFESEIRLLKLLVAGDRQQVATLVLSRNIDFRQLEVFLETEHLADFFLALLEDHRLLKLFPGYLRNQLQWLREHHQTRHIQLQQTMSRLQCMFAQNDIELIVLKGLPLAERYWGGTDRRFVWDLDLLIKPEDLEKAICLTNAAGFAPVSARFLPRSIAIRLTHATELTADDTAVDLHWAFRRRPGFRINYQGVWQRALTWHYDSVEYKIPSAEDSLLIMLLGIAQDAERGHCSYRKLWDIYLWLRAEQDIDWQAFIRRCKDEGVAVLCLNMLALTVLALDCAAEFPQLQVLLQDRQDSVSCSAAEVEIILSRSRQHLGNRLWFARLQAVPAWYYLIWWTLTAPMRYLLGRNI